MWSERAGLVQPRASRRGQRRVQELDRLASLERGRACGRLEVSPWRSCRFPVARSRSTRGLRVSAAGCARSPSQPILGAVELQDAGTNWVVDATDDEALLLVPNCRLQRTQGATARGAGRGGATGTGICRRFLFFSLAASSSIACAVAIARRKVLLVILIPLNLDVAVRARRGPRPGACSPSGDRGRGSRDAMRAALRHRHLSASNCPAPAAPRISRGIRRCRRMPSPGFDTVSRSDTAPTGRLAIEPARRRGQGLLVRRGPCRIREKMRRSDSRRH